MRHVPGDTLRRTTECPYEFVCLGNGAWEPCPVASRAGYEKLRLDSVAHPKCPYLSNLSECRLCVCPTRSALYDTEGR